MPSRVQHIVKFKHLSYEDDGYYSTFCEKSTNEKINRKLDLCVTCLTRQHNSLKKGILKKLTAEEKAYLWDFHHDFERKRTKKFTQESEC